MPDLSGRASIDTTDFKTAISGMNRELRVLESEFRASAASLGDWGSSADGLRGRIDSLGRQMDIQRQKVQALTDEHARVAAAEGENSRAAQELQIKLNQATEQLNKMQTESDQTAGKLEQMGSASNETSGKVEDLGKKEQKTGEESDKLGGKLDGLKAFAIGLGGAMAAAAGAVAGVAAGIGKMISSSTEQAGALVDLSVKTGISVEQLQRYSYIGEQVGVSLDTITGSQARLIRQMSEGDQAFGTLGISIKDANGSLRNSETVMMETLAALGKIQNPAERDAMAMQLFGKSAMELNPLIKTSAEEMARLSEEAQNSGAIMSEDNVGALEEFGDQLAGLKAGLQGTAGTIAAAFMPAVSGLAGTAQKYLGQFSAVVSGANGDLTKMAGGAGTLIGQIAAELATSGPKMLEGGLAIVNGIVNALVQNIPVIMPAVVQMLMAIVQFVVEGIPMIISAAVQIILALANGLASAIPQLIPAVMQIIPQVINTLLENLPLLIGAALQIIIALVQGLVTALPQLIAYVPELLIAMVDTITESLPIIGDAAITIIVTLVNGLIDSLPKLKDAATTLLTGFKDKFIEMLDVIKEVGTNIVLGVWEGIQEKATWLYDQVKNFFKRLFKVVTDEEEINSPSEKWARLGAYMAQGLGAGFTRQWNGVEGQIAGAVAGLNGISANPSINLQGGLNGASGSGYGNTYQYYFNFKDTTLTEAELERILARQEALYGA